MELGSGGQHKCIYEKHNHKAQPNTLIIFGSGIEVRYDGDSAKIYENTIYNNATKGDI